LCHSWRRTFSATEKDVRLPLRREGYQFGLGEESEGREYYHRINLSRRIVNHRLILPGRPNVIRESPSNLNCLSLFCICTQTFVRWCYVCTADARQRSSHRGKGKLLEESDAQDVGAGGPFVLVRGWGLYVLARCEIIEVRSNAMGDIIRGNTSIRML